MDEGANKPINLKDRQEQTHNEKLFAAKEGFTTLSQPFGHHSNCNHHSVHHHHFSGHIHSS